MAHATADPASMRRVTLAWTALDANHAVGSIRLPCATVSTEGLVDRLWALRPDSEQHIMIHGRQVAIPRRQLAMGRDYRFSGGVSEAVPFHELVEPFRAWCRTRLDDRLNGALVNWYANGSQYIGRHRDAPRGLIDGAPIVTISLGATRVLRMRPYQGKGFVDVQVPHGTAVVIPSATNRAWTHEVPRSLRCHSRRVSLTFRAFA